MPFLEFFFKTFRQIAQAEEFGTEIVKLFPGGAAMLEGFARQLIDNTETRLAVGGAMLAFWLGYFFLLRRIPAGSETA